MKLTIVLFTCLSIVGLALGQSSFGYRSEALAANPWVRAAKPEDAAVAGADVVQAVRKFHALLLSGSQKSFETQTWEFLQAHPHDGFVLKNLVALFWVAIKKENRFTAAFTDIIPSGCAPLKTSAQATSSIDAPKRQQIRRHCGSQGLVNVEIETDNQTGGARLFFGEQGSGFGPAAHFSVQALGSGNGTGSGPEQEGLKVVFGPRIHWFVDSKSAHGSLRPMGGMVRLYLEPKPSGSLLGFETFDRPAPLQYLTVFRLEPGGRSCLRAAVAVANVTDNYALAEALGLVFMPLVACDAGGAPLIIRN